MAAWSKREIFAVTLSYHKGLNPVVIIVFPCHSSSRIGIVCVIFYFLSRYMRPEGPWQRWWAFLSPIVPCARTGLTGHNGPPTPRTERKNKRNVPKPQKIIKLGAGCGRALRPPTHPLPLRPEHYSSISFPELDLLRRLLGTARSEPKFSTSADNAA